MGIVNERKYALECVQQLQQYINSFEGNEDEMYGHVLKLFSRIWSSDEGMAQHLALKLVDRHKLDVINFYLEFDSSNEEIFLLFYKM
ncbi:hypothetical protein [Flammeovirga agarivorans]|uniref:Uncharacterized protein n=1 Tax=Flammeovirga agarivorans TaxID=2726742 RepID=A0A7X8SRJ5_9BACT|nr:hypothetical protein [Flammeovirga agarivorans]NLR94958.1 hypothetical protein [Flammeovirga agarivorans]